MRKKTMLVSSGGPIPIISQNVLHVADGLYVLAA